MKHLGKATLGVVIFYLWIYLTGPVGMVVGGVAFLGGFALGHRTGRKEAENDLRERVLRSIRFVRMYDREGER